MTVFHLPFTENITPVNNQRASISLETPHDSRPPSQPSLNSSAHNSPSKNVPPSKIASPSGKSQLSKSTSAMSNASTISTVSTASVNTVNTVVTVANQDQSTDHTNKKATGAISEKNQPKSNDKHVNLHSRDLFLIP